MKRGFKAQAERKSLEIRSNLSIEKHGYLSAQALADYIGIKVIGPEQISGIDSHDVTTLKRSDSPWSAIVLGTTPPLIIHNGNHSSARQESNLMHELSHIICGHPFTETDLFPASLIREYPEEFEEEAKYMGGCLQIPREALVWAKTKRMSKEAIASHFHASKQMVTYRINVTGINRQFG